MREKRTLQVSLFEHYAEHEIGHELKAISAWLDNHLDLLDLIEADLRPQAVAETGRKGLTVESVLRCAILKQYRQLSYDDLVFSLLDSTTCQTFARLTSGWTPQRTALQQAITAISSTTWEKINHRVLQSAHDRKLEKGEVLRMDSTVTETPIHAPSDSTLLWDAVRTLVRLLTQAEALAGESDRKAIRLPYCNHQRVAKKRMRAIHYTRGPTKKVALYRDLIGYTEKSLQYVRAVERVLRSLGFSQTAEFKAWRSEVMHFKPLIEQVIDQTRRRVLTGEKVPAAEKIFSLFEAHTDIIIKGSRDIQYGHKLNLCTGRSGLVLDVVIEAGNPSDTDRFLPMLDRHIDLYGKAPRQMAADGGYASGDNLQGAKARNVTDVIFHKKRGLNIEDMAKSPWVYRKLRNFRAGIEAGISCLKRAYGLARSTWKGLTHFKAYVWSSVVAHNLALYGRLLTT